MATLLPVLTLLSLDTDSILALSVPCHLVGLVLASFLTDSPMGFRTVQPSGNYWPENI